MERTCFLSRANRWFCKNTIGFSLFFIAVNPLSSQDENNKKNQTDSSNSVNRVSASQSISRDFQTAGKTFLAQQMVNPPVMMSGKDNFSYAVPDFSFNTSADNNSVGFHIESLVQRYLERAKDLIEGKSDLQSIKLELEKVYLVDPNNAEARFLENIVRNLYNDEQNKTEDMQFVKASAVDSEAAKEALLEAERQLNIKKAFATASNEKLQKAKQFYEQGKKALFDGNLIEAIDAFNSVIDLGEDSIYSDYSKKFIKAACDRIKKEEEAAFDAFCSENFAGKLAQKAEKVPDDSIFEEEVQEEEKLKKAETNKQIEDAFASARSFMENKEYNKAADALTFILQLDADNAEAKNMFFALENIFEKERQMELVEQERKKALIEAKGKRRGKAKESIEKKYQGWSALNEQALAREISRKVQELFLFAKADVSSNNILSAQKYLGQIFSLNPGYEDALLLKDEIEEKVKEMQAFFACGKIEKTQTEKSAEENFSLNSDNEMSEKNGKEEKVEDDSIDRVVSFEPLFSGLSGFKPFTVLSGGSESKEKNVDVKVNTAKKANDNFRENKKERKVKITKVILPVKQSAKEERKVIVKKVFFSEEKIDDEQGNVDKTFSLSGLSLSQDNENKVKAEMYYKRALKHLDQQNYSLALVALNRVKWHDPDGKYIVDLDKEIDQVTEELEKKE